MSMSTTDAVEPREQDGKSVNLQPDTAKVVTRPDIRLQDLYLHTTIVVCRYDRQPYGYVKAIIMRPANYEEAIEATIKIFGATNVYQVPKSNSNVQAGTMVRTHAAPSLRCRLRASGNYWMEVDPHCWDIVVDHMEFLLVNRWTREEVDLGVPNYD